MQCIERKQDDEMTQAAPKTLNVFRQLYWTFRKDHSARRHIVRAITNSVRLAIKLRQRSWTKPVVALALVEHMGDVIAAEPVARATRAHFPKTWIIWITREPYRSLPDAYPEVDETIIVGCLTEWHLLWSYGILNISRDMHLSGAACPICQSAFYKRGKAGTYTSDTYYDQGSLLAARCATAGLDQVTDGPVLVPARAAVEAVDALGLPETFIVVHAKSNEEIRNWTDFGWGALIDAVNGWTDIKVVEIGLTQSAGRSNAETVINLCGRLSIIETAEVIRRAKLFVGIDSGPAHLANAVGTPGVLLLGTYHGFRTHMPYSGNYENGISSTILRAKGQLASLDIVEVIRAVENMLRAKRG